MPRTYMGKDVTEDQLAGMVRAYKAGRDVAAEEVEGVEDVNRVREEDEAILKELEEAGVDPLRPEFARELGAKAGGQEAKEPRTTSTLDRLNADAKIDQDNRDARERERVRATGRVHDTDTEGKKVHMPSHADDKDTKKRTRDNS